MSFYLPPELWQRIFSLAATNGNSTEPARFYLTARRVSRDWRAGIEKVYANLYLRDREHCRVDISPYSPYAIEMAFDRYEEQDKSRCVFKETDRTAISFENQSIKLMRQRDRMRIKKWKENVLGKRGQASAYRLNSYVISMGTTSEIALPGLECNFEQLEMSFDWAAMLQVFFVDQLKNADAKGKVMVLDLAPRTTS